MRPPKRSETVTPAMPAIDMGAVRQMFDDIDLNGDGNIDFEEFTHAIIRLGVQPGENAFKEAVGSK